MSEARRGVEYAGTGHTRHGDSVACYATGCDHANGRLTCCRRHLLAKWRGPRLGDLAISEAGESCPHFVVGIFGENFAKTETEGRG